MDSWQLIELLEKHPSMFGVDGTFREIAIFLEGVDVAKDGALLSTFHKWLVLEVGEGQNLSWSALILRLASRGQQSMPSVPRELSSREDRVVVNVLFEALARYKADLSKPNGMLRIYDAYLTWLKRQDWYNRDSPSYID